MIGVFKQARPAADRLSQGAWTGALASFSNGHIGNLAQGAPHQQTHFLRREQVDGYFQKTPQSPHRFKRFEKTDSQHANLANFGGLDSFIDQYRIGYDQRRNLLGGC